MKRILSLILLLAPALLWAQQTDSLILRGLHRYQPLPDSGWITHMTVGTGISSSSLDLHGYTYLAPTFDRRVNDRLALHGGFAMFLDNAEKYQIRGYDGRDLAPRKSSSMMAAARFAARYQASPNLWVAASAFVIGGQYDPFWNFSGAPLDLMAYGLTAALGYKFDSGTSLNLYFNIVRDQAGTLPPWIYDPCYGYGYGLGCWGTPHMFGHYNYDLLNPMF